MSQPVSWSSDKPVVFIHQMDHKLLKVEERILLINTALNLIYFLLHDSISDSVYVVRRKKGVF